MLQVKSHTAGFLSPTAYTHSLLLSRAPCRQNCSLWKTKLKSRPPAIWLACKLVAVQDFAKCDDTENPLLRNRNMLLSKSTVELPSCALDRLIKQRRDVFLLVSVSRTQHHYSILHNTTHRKAPVREKRPASD